MTRWKLLIDVGFVLLLLICMGGWWAISAPSAVSAYDQIRLGMTLAEVEGVIGQPGRDTWAHLGGFCPSSQRGTSFVNARYRVKVVRESGIPYVEGPFLDPFAVKSWQFMDMRILV